MPGVYYAGTDDGTVSVSTDAGKSWTEHHRSHLPGFPDGGWSRKVVPSRYDAGHRLRHRRQSSPRTTTRPYIWVSNDFGATFHSLKANMHGRVGQDAHRRSAQSGRAVHRHRNGHSSCRSTAARLAAAQRRTYRRARRRDHAPSARQRDARRDARPRDLDPRPPRADPGIHRGAGGAAGAKLFTIDHRARVEVEGRSQRRVLGPPVLRRRESAV